MVKGSQTVSLDCRSLRIAASNAGEFLFASLRLRHLVWSVFLNLTILPILVGVEWYLMGLMCIS